MFRNSSSTSEERRYRTGPEQAAKVIATKNIPPQVMAEIRGMLDLHEISRGPALKPLGLWLIGQARRTWPRWAGLTVFKRTSDRRRFIIASMHHPAHLCWQWSLSIRFGVRGSFRRPLAGFLGLSGTYGQRWITVPFLFELRYHRQPYDYMLSQQAKWRLDAMAMPRGSFSLEAWAGE